MSAFAVAAGALRYLDYDAVLRQENFRPEEIVAAALIAPVAGEARVGTYALARETVTWSNADDA